MFDLRTNYPTAVTSSDDDGIDAGFQWCVNHMEDNDVFTVWTHQKNNFGNNPKLEALVNDHNLDHITARGGAFKRDSGPVLMAWADPNDIAEFMQFSSHYVRALCVISWDEDRLAPWAAIIQAELLGNLREWNPAIPDLHPAVSEEMEYLTRSINHNNTIAAGYEKDVVVRALLDLHDAGYQLDGPTMSAWATAHGWCGSNPAELEKYINNINGGRRPRTRQSRCADHVRQLRARRGTS